MSGGVSMLALKSVLFRGEGIPPLTWYAVAAGDLWIGVLIATYRALIAHRSHRSSLTTSNRRSDACKEAQDP